MTSAFEKTPPAKLEAKIYGFLEREKLMSTDDGNTTSKFVIIITFIRFLLISKIRKVYCIFAIDPPPRNSLPRVTYN